MWSFKLCLFWRCLRRLSNLRRSVFVFVTRLLCLLSIPLRKTLVYFLLCSFLLISLLVSGISPVLADDPTQTPTPIPPTPTWQYLFVTPTPRPTENNTCPVGNPINYLTQTPNPRWEYKCSHCITKTPYYVFPTSVPSQTPTPDLSLTPQPTGTPEPTAVPTDPYFQASVLQHMPSVLLENEVPFNTTVYNVQIDLYAVDTSAYVFTTGFEIHNHSVLHAAGSGQGVWLIDFFNAASHSYIVDCVEGCSWHNRVVAGYSQNQVMSIYNWSPPIDYTFDESIKFNISSYTAIDPQEGPAFFAVNTWANSGGNTVDHTITYTNGGIDYVAPEPTPGPSYCGIVDPLDPNQPPSFELPTPIVGPNTCFTVPDFYFELTFLHELFPEQFPVAPALDVPQFQVCFRPIMFGNLTLFDFSINLDLIALMMAGVLIIRLILRSI